MFGTLAKLRATLPAWMGRLLSDGGPSETRFGFLGAFAVGSVVIFALFAAIVWVYLRHATADASLCLLAGGSFTSYLGFATHAQNTKLRTDAGATTVALQAAAEHPQTQQRLPAQ